MIMRTNRSELTELIRRVFTPEEMERSVAILVDLPDRAVADNPDWHARREMAAGWLRELDTSPAPADDERESKVPVDNGPGDRP